MAFHQPPTVYQLPTIEYDYSKLGQSRRPLSRFVSIVLDHVCAWEPADFRATQPDEVAMNILFSGGARLEVLVFKGSWENFENALRNLPTTV